MKDAGWTVSKNTVAAVMREMGLAARPKKKRRFATRPGRGRWRAPDLVKRDFLAAKINRKWYGDGTEIPTDEGMSCLDSVLDAASRRILGKAASPLTPRRLLRRRPAGPALTPETTAWTGQEL